MQQIKLFQGIKLLHFPVIKIFLSVVLSAQLKVFFSHPRASFPRNFLVISRLFFSCFFTVPSYTDRIPFHLVFKEVQNSFCFLVSLYQAALAACSILFMLRRSMISLRLFLAPSQPSLCMRIFIFLLT